MILLIDNYDSFSYNLYQLIGQLNTDIKTVRNDQITIKEIIDLNPEAIVLSPGPGRPVDAGICVSLVKELKGKYPILGVCLGHGTLVYVSLQIGKTQIFQDKRRNLSAVRSCSRR